MFSETTFLLVFGLGALCMILGFFLVLRGVGASDSESAIKLIGVEIRASRVGPGVLFALFGLVLIVTALAKQPGPATETRAAATPAPAAGPVEAGGRSDAPASPSPATTPTGDDGYVEEPEPPAVAVTQADPVRLHRNREAQMIRQFLSEAVQGGCNPAILGPAPLMDCQRSMPLMQPQLAAAGPAVSVSYLASMPTPLGTADRFVVQHQSGTTATWTGVLGNDGRFVTLVSP